MRLNQKRWMFGLRTAVVFLAAGLLSLSTAMSALAVDDTIKQIERKLSSVKRNIPTSPDRAEKDYLEARAMLQELEKTDPGQTQLSVLKKNMEQLGEQLEKRLKRPIGESAPVVEKSAASPAPAAVATALPSAVSSRLKKIDQNLDALEAALSKHQLQTAESKLNTARKTMDEIESRYGDKIPEGDPEMKATIDRLTAATKEFEAAKATAADAAAAEARAKEAKEAQSREWIDRFAPFSDAGSDAYLLMGASFNAASEERQERCRQAYAEANALIAEYQHTDFPHGKTQDLEFMASGLQDKVRIYNEAETKARQQEACREWLMKLRAYVDSGSGSRKYLIASVTASEDQIKEQEALFNEAQGVWAEYQKTEFPLGKTPGLVQVEKEMKERLAEMPEALRRSRALIAGDLEGELDRILAYLNKDTGWKSDTGKKPNIAMPRDVEPMYAAIERYAGSVDAGDAKLAVLKEKIAEIEATDKANRKIRAERTFMEPERYKSSDAENLRQKVNEIVSAKSGAVLRISLMAQDWKEEDVLEWTDTSRTQVRYRITKSMTAQAAAKSDDGRVYLHGVHLASDRQSDGGWGPLYGHIMWSDWMMEKNVDQ